MTIGVSVHQRHNGSLEAAQILKPSKIQRNRFLQCSCPNRLYELSLNSTIYKSFKTSGKIVSKRKRKQKRYRKAYSNQIIVSQRNLLGSVTQAECFKVSFSKHITKVKEISILIARKSRLLDVLFCVAITCDLGLTQLLKIR